MGNTTTLGNKSKFRELVDSFGLPRLIIACFLLLLLIAAPCVGLDFPTQITNIITRFSWNAVMVLAMVPMVHSGCGLNFGLPLGIVSGLLGATLSIELGYTGFASFLMAILIATPFALLFGGGYGWLLNKIKGGEMMIATYVGFSSVSFMCMMWLLLPYKHPTMVWGFSASGLRTVISLEGYYDKALANIQEQHPEMSYTSSFVIGRDPLDSFWGFTLDRGTLDGVAVNDAVISDEGYLLGVVREADLTSCKVMTILHPSFNAAGVVSRTRDNGIITGSADYAADGLCILSNLARSTLSRDGDQVITTGLGGVFPPDVLVGVIKELTPEASGKSTLAVIQPGADPRTVRHVFIITNY